MAKQWDRSFASVSRLVRDIDRAQELTNTSWALAEARHRSLALIEARPGVRSVFRSGLGANGPGKSPIFRAAIAVGDRPSCIFT